MNSWLEQRTCITDAPALLIAQHAELAAQLQDAFNEIRSPVLPDVSEYTIVTEPVGTSFECSIRRVSFDETASLSQVTEIVGGRAWATSESPIGQYSYETYTNDDFN